MRVETKENIFHDVNWFRDNDFKTTEKLKLIIIVEL